MSSVKGAGATKIAAMTPADMLPGPFAGNKISAFIDTYTCATLVSGSDITLGPKLPIGARIIDWQIDHAALGTGVTLSLGNAAASAALMALTASATAAKKTMAANGVAATMGYLIDAANKQQILITTGGASGIGAIVLMVKYIPAA